jgi:sec-independent protein translocase protein TatA
MDIGPPELLIIVIVLLVLFGGSQIPKLAKNLGKAQVEFKKGLADVRGESAAEPEPAAAAAAGEPAEPVADHASELVEPAEPVASDDSHDSTV